MSQATSDSKDPFGLEAYSRSPAGFPRPLLIPTPSKAYIDLRVHLSIPL